MLHVKTMENWKKMTGEPDV